MGVYNPDSLRWSVFIKYGAVHDNAFSDVGNTITSDCPLPLLNGLNYISIILGARLLLGNVYIFQAHYDNLVSLLLYRLIRITPNWRYGSKITSNSTVYSTICLRKQQSPHYWPIVRGIHRWAVDRLAAPGQTDSCWHTAALTKFSPFCAWYLQIQFLLKFF